MPSGAKSVKLSGAPVGRRALLLTALAVATTLGVASVAGAFGTFKPKADYEVSDPEGLAVADFNGDGRRDLAAASYNDDLVAILLGKKNGKFAAAQNYPVGTGTGPYDVAAGDFNSDGRPDVAVTEITINKVAIMLAKKGGKLGAPTSYPVGAAPYGVTVGDVNGDGRPDVTTVNEGDETISLRLGKKNG
ncbi:MAG: VCBS repeat-containing protein, partial [Solirubrobacterales bacterium]|nr:VCBS repeat-containing protein [Solirubrobacterales bacterium]